MFTRAQGLCREYLEFQFMPGKFTDRDKKIAKLIHAYEKAFDENSDTAAVTFPTTRVITVDSTVEPGNQVHTYDQVQTFIDTVRSHRGHRLLLPSCRSPA